jgi:hypothetical protein
MVLARVPPLALVETGPPRLPPTPNFPFLQPTPSTLEQSVPLVQTVAIDPRCTDRTVGLPAINATGHSRKRSNQISPHSLKQKNEELEQLNVCRHKNMPVMRSK